VARELTKTHEEFVRDSLGALAARYADDRPLGEITIVVGGASGERADSDDELDERAARLLAGGQSARDVAQQLAGETSTSRPATRLYEAGGWLLFKAPPNRSSVQGGPWGRNDPRSVRSRPMTWMLPPGEDLYNAANRAARRSGLANATFLAAQPCPSLSLHRRYGNVPAMPGVHG
jgi:hypothetical protein